MSQEQTYISSAMMRSVIRFLETQGLQPEELAKAAGFSLSDLEAEDALINAETYPKVMQTAIEITKQADLGFQLGKQASPDRWGVLGYIMSSCSTLAEAIQCQQRYQQLVGSIGQIKIDLNGPFIRLVWDTNDTPLPAIAEEAVTGWITYGRWITGQQKAPHKVYFRHHAPTKFIHYEDYFQCPINFEADINGIEFPFTFLNLPLKQANKENKDWLLSIADQQLSALNKTPALLVDLKQFIAQNLPKQVPELDEAAQHFELNPRSLQRKLKKEGFTYKKLLENTRMDLAKRFLQHSDYSIIEITFLLGFSEQSAFTRAFKRSIGKSPGEFRKTNLMGHNAFSN